LREGLGIEVIVDRITSGKGNKKQINTAIIKIKKYLQYLQYLQLMKMKEAILEIFQR
jgi:hypothetical protein